MVGLFEAAGSRRQGRGVAIDLLLRGLSFFAFGRVKAKKLRPRKREEGRNPGAGANRPVGCAVMRITSLTSARIAVAAAFFAQGFVFISLTTRLPRFLEQWGMDEVALSLLLLMMVLLAGVGSLVAERAAHRLGSAPMLRLGLALMVVAVPTITLAPAMAFFVGGVALYGIALGLVDATTNMQAVDLEHRYGRPILPSSHGYWTTGGITAAIIALATGHLSPEVGAAVAVVPLAIAFARFLPRVASGAGTPGLISPVPGPTPGPTTAGAGSPGVGYPDAVSPGVGSPGTSTDAAPVPWRPIWLVGAGLVVFYMVDTTASAWGPVYLARSFDAPGNLVALATFPYLLTSIVVRLAGGQLVTRFGVVPLLRIGAVVACGALTLVALAPTWQVAVAGFTVLGAAVALVAPLSFSAAGRIASGPASSTASGPASRRADGGADGGVSAGTSGRASATPSANAWDTASGTGDVVEPDRARTDAVIARFNQFNYVGALLGSVLTGFVGAENLRLGFALPAILVLALVPLAPAFARGALSRR
ncbi:MFS transporter [Promicromonospora kroppenstedtii]|uniref:MFS transporter n=1 Tax=Promicromonospora kroppenstedtii TaxID=440482 RepID=A0ABW7XHZ4_9MICO